MLMKNEIQKLLQKLQIELNISKEILAVKFQVSTMTIDRWTRGETNPSYAEKLLLKRIYNGYKSRK